MFSKMVRFIPCNKYVTLKSQFWRTLRESLVKVVVSQSIQQLLRWPTSDQLTSWDLVALMTEFAYNSPIDRSYASEALDLLRCPIDDQPTSWDLVALMTEFAYNTPIDISMHLRPFEVVNSYRPRTVDIFATPTRYIKCILFNPSYNICMTCITTYAKRLHS